MSQKQEVSVSWKEFRERAERLRQHAALDIEEPAPRNEYREDERSLTPSEKMDLKERETLLGEQVKYAGKAFSMVRFWLVGLLFILACHGFNFCGFTLSDDVFSWLLGTTTATVVGIFVIITRYLFPKQKHDNYSK